MAISRQAHYQWQHRRVQEEAKYERVLEQVRAKRLHQPRLGTRKLHHLIAPALAAQGLGIGRDALFNLLRCARLLVPGLEPAWPSQQVSTWIRTGHNNKNN